MFQTRTDEGARFNPRQLHQTKLTDTMLDSLTLINSGLRREWAFPLVMRLPPPSL